MLVKHMVTEHDLSTRRGCQAVGLARSTYRYQAKVKDDQAVIDALQELVDAHPAIGFWQAFHRLRAAGRSWNHKRVYRVYTALKLNIRRRAKKRLPVRVKQQLFEPERSNQVWSLPGPRPGPLHARQLVGWPSVSSAQRDGRLQSASALD
ncbi:MAG: hypothetical protein RhofKO_42630 [Rhodothermales bacterium]